MTYAQWRARLIEAMDLRLYLPNHLDIALQNGAQFLANEKAAIVFGVKTYPTGAKVLHGLCAVGELDSIKELIAQAEGIGRRAGCIAASIESRPGWARTMKDYATYQVAIWKDLTDGR